MKIVVLGPAWPFRGGIAQLNESLVAALMRAGHTVQVVNFTTQYPAIIFPGKSQYTDGPKPEGLTAKRMLSSINPISWCRTARYIIDQQPDLVLVRYWLPFMAPALGTVCRKVRKAGIKVVAVADNIVPHEHRPGDHALTRYFLKGTSGILYMSGQVGNELITQFAYDRPTAFSPHPIYDVYGDAVPRQEACRELGLDPAKQYVLFFGFIRPYKGLDLLLEAWESSPDRQLIVAGEFYGHKEEYMPQIEAKEVLLHDDYIPSDRVKYYFSAASLVVQPYKSATQSGVTQIAYNFGTPMVVTDVGGLSEIVPNGKVGYVVPVSVSAIRSAIDEFFRLDYHDAFAQNMVKERQRFEWSAMVAAIEELWKSC